jgi:hypothetical protein
MNGRTGYSPALVRHCPLPTPGRSLGCWCPQITAIPAALGVGTFEENGRIIDASLPANGGLSYPSAAASSCCGRLVLAAAALLLLLLPGGL